MSWHWWYLGAVAFVSLTIVAAIFRFYYDEAPVEETAFSRFMVLRVLPAAIVILALSLAFLTIRGCLAQIHSVIWLYLTIGSCAVAVIGWLGAALGFVFADKDSKITPCGFRIMWLGVALMLISALCFLVFLGYHGHLSGFSEVDL